MTNSTATAQQSLSYIAAELKINLRRVIATAKSEKMCTNLADKFINQLAECEFSKSMIRRSIFAAIEEVKKSNLSVGNEKLIRENIKEYTDENGEIKQKVYVQHYAFTTLYNRLDEFGLLRGNATGFFTIAELKGETVNVKVDKRENKKVQKKDNLTVQVGNQTAIDVTKYLEVAQKFLNSNNWEENIIGVEMSVPRRNVEVGLSVDFYADDEYTLVISTPAKKNEVNTFYLIPCLINSQLICETVEKIRKNKPELLSDIYKKLGDEQQAKVAFNNSERTRIEEIYNQTVRTFLPTEAGINGRDNQHQLKNIGTCILKQIKSNSLGNLVGNESILDTWISKAVAHKYEETTNKYITWKVTNIPGDLSVIATKEYGQVSPDYVGVEVEFIENNGDNEMTVLLQKMLELSVNDENKLKAVQGVFMHSDGTVKSVNEIAQSLDVIFSHIADTGNKQTKLHKALGIKSSKNLNESRIEAITDALIIHNETAETNLQVHISESTVRGFFGVFLNDDGNPASINFSIVQRVFSSNELDKKASNHNAYKGLENAQNLRWRKSKDKIVESLQKIIQDKFPDVI